MILTRLSIVLAAAAIAAACASTPGESEMLAAMAQAECTPQKPGRREPPEQIVSEFRRSMPAPAWILFEIAPEDPTLDLEMLQSLFRLSSRRDIHMGVWGGDSAVVRAIVLKALDQPELRTEHLKVMFFGTPEDQALVATAVQARGGELIARPATP